MATITLRFAIRLHNSEINALRELHGPLFHRWLPDGISDALTLKSNDPNAEISVWFERRGYLDFRDLIQFDYQRQEVNPDIVSEQAILDAGPLRGSLVIKNINRETIKILQENKSGEKGYITLGKRIVKILYPSLTSLIKSLRVRYGQYWIDPLEKWDSQKDTLGAYCKSVLHLKYSLDDEDTWFEFMPDDPIRYVKITAIAPNKKTFSQYLTKNDWLESKGLVDSEYKPSLAADILISAYQLLDSRNYRQAFIEGVTALELALNELFRERLSENNTLVNEIQSFWTLPLRAQFAVAASLTPDIAQDDIAQTLKAIKVRNGIVHEGQQVDEQRTSELRSLIATTAKIIPGPGFKLPSAHIGNNIRMSDEQWNSLE